MTDVIGRTASSATPTPGSDTFVTPSGDTFSLAWHRDRIHPAPQHGCVLCPPTPCSCGYRGDVCPDYFEHRRNNDGAEIAVWRAAA